MYIIYIGVRANIIKHVATYWSISNQYVQYSDAEPVGTKHIDGNASSATSKRVHTKGLSG